MIAEAETPVDLLKDVAELIFPPETESRMIDLMDRNTEGVLTPVERDELRSLVKWSHQIALLRARALLILGRRP